MNGKLTTQYCPGVDMQEWFFLLLSHEIAVKRVYWINLHRRKRTECEKLPLGTLVWNTVTLQLNVPQSVVSRALKEYRESGSIIKRKRSTLIWSARNCYWSIMVCGAWSDDHLTQLKVVTGTLNAQKYQDEFLESGVRSRLDSLDGQNMVLRDDIASPHCTRINQEYKNQQNTVSLPRPSALPDLNPIEHVWDKLGWRVWNREPAVSKPLWILLNSTARVGQDFMSWTHAPNEFNDENVPSCYSTV